MLNLLLPSSAFLLPQHYLLATGLVKRSLSTTVC